MLNEDTKERALNEEGPKTYGLVVFYQPCPEIQPVFHISQRRDTLAYIHFIRGCVPDEKLEMWFSRMTLEEKNRLITQYSFEELWCDLFSQSFIEGQQFSRAKEKFERLRENGILNDLVNTPSIELEWGIPKGRKKNIHEPDAVCAQREYREETRNKCYLEFVDHPPIRCVLPSRGGGCIDYYIARSKFCPHPRFYSLNFGNIERTSISEETGDLRWLTFQNAEKLLPNVYQKVLQEVMVVLKNRYEFILLRDIALKYGSTHSDYLGVVEEVEKSD